MAVTTRHLAGVPMAEGQAWAVEVWAARGLPDWVVLRALVLRDDGDEPEETLRPDHRMPPSRRGR